MPTGYRDLTTRQNSLVDYLLNQDRTVTVSEVAEALDCGERTVRRDVQKLIAYGVDIERVSGRSGGLRFRHSPFDTHQTSITCQSPPQDVPVIGRDAEALLLRTVLASARAPVSNFAFVTGGPGIGKTRLVSDSYENAISLGIEPFWFTCSESSGAMPFSVWTQFFERLQHSRGTSFLTGVPPDRINHIAAVVPEMSWASDNPKELFDNDSNYSLQVVHRTIAALIASAVEDWPIAIVIDDLQWADSSSVQMLEHLLNEANTSRLVVLCTARSEDPQTPVAVTEMLNSARRSSRSKIIELKQLDEGSMSELTDFIMGPGP
ncbi:MAG: AAA family ATPase, partial [Dehalococcoidia bacterium]